MGENKVVHFNLFKPENALFKQKANAQAEIQIITCSNSENCQLVKRGECACRAGLYGSICPYGKRSRETGYSRRSQKYSSWCANKKEIYKGVPFLNAPKSLGVVGDYVFIPYAHVRMIKNFPWEDEGFIKKENFTPENVIRLIGARPQAMFGGEITSYQKKVPPLMLKHLSEQMPELFNDLISKDVFCKKRYEEFSNIGREAILETLTPNVGTLKDIHGGVWVWDGFQLHSENSRMSFGLCEFSKITITPVGGQKAKITDEGQVNKDTIFIG